MSRLKLKRYYMDRPGDRPWTRLRHRLTRRPIPDFPRTVQIQTLTGCNADCVFCPYGATHDGQPKGRMSDDLFRSLIEECAAHDVRRITPNLMNEPLLDRALCDRIRLVHDLIPACKVVLTTNGHYLDADTASRLLDLGDGLHEIFVSVQGIDREAYERTMRGTMRFERTVANVENFVAAQRRRGTDRPRLWVTMVDTAWIDARAAVAWWRARGVPAKYTFLENRGGNIEDAQEMARGALRPYSTCPRLFKQAYILFNGDMVLCCVDYARRHVLGNVAGGGIAAVWNGREAVEARRRYIDGEFGRLPLCGSCRVGSIREVSVEASGRTTVAAGAAD